jgi:alcohol/geraniol dehydrogenase (NADP+)
MIKVKAYQAKQQNTPLINVEIEYPDLSGKQVLVKITHCGVCRSDVHFIQNDWGDSEFPLVPGHEIVGVVEAIGPDVVKLKNNQRVGAAWQQGACGHCEWCHQEQEEFCQKLEAVCHGKQGGFADYVIVDEDYLFVLPESLDSAHATPLFCAGSTIFNALYQCSVKANERVAIVGIGGLGHLGLQFAKAMGCHVTAVSHTPEKEKEAADFGADDFILLKDIAEHQNQFDLIIPTIDVDFDYQLLIDALRPLGKLCFAGIPVKPIDVSVFSLIIGQKMITAIPAANRKTTNLMLDFAAKHQITPKIECKPMAEVNKVLKDVDAGSAHYRWVLVNE